MSTRKRGALSTEDKNYIQRNVHEMTVQEIADNLNRSINPVEKYIQQNNLHIHNKEEEKELAILEKKLTIKPYWPEVKAQLTKNELAYFISTWSNLYMQFREDVTYSEELSIKQLIVIEILMDRSMKERRVHQEDLERIQKSLDEEYAKSVEVRDKDMIISLETQVAFSRTAISAFTKEHTTLLNERKFLDKSLKATRDERIKRLEDGNTSFTGILRMLEDERLRERLGKEAELMRMAKDKAKEDLSEWHQYADDTVDRPFLSPETVGDDE